MTTIKVPLYPATKALYQTLQHGGVLNGGACGLEWYEGGSDIEEIEDDFKGQATFCYGILGVAEADQNDRDNDIWDYSIQLEIYSNYPGRKIVAQKLQELMVFLSQPSTWQQLDEILLPEGFTTISMSIGPHRLNPAIRGENGNWQSGSVNVTIKLNQV